MMNTYSLSEARFLKQQSELSQSIEPIKETHVLEGRLVVNTDRQSGFVEVKSEEIRALITKYYTSTIIASMENTSSFVNLNELFQFDSKPNYPVQVVSNPLVE